MPSSHRRTPSHESQGDALRGLVNAAILSLPIWALIGFVAWSVFG